MLDSLICAKFAKISLGNLVLVPAVIEFTKPPGRVIQDEGFLGALRFVSKLVSYPAARKRLLAMRTALKKYEDCSAHDRCLPELSCYPVVISTA